MQAHCCAFSGMAMRAYAGLVEGRMVPGRLGSYGHKYRPAVFPLSAMHRIVGCAETNPRDIVGDRVPDRGVCAPFADAGSNDIPECDPVLFEQGSADGIRHGVVYPKRSLYNLPELVLRVAVIFTLCKRLAAGITAENEDLRARCPRLVRGPVSSRGLRAVPS